LLRLVTRYFVRGDSMRSRHPLWRAFDFVLIVVVLALAAFILFAIVTAIQA